MFSTFTEASKAGALISEARDPQIAEKLMHLRLDRNISGFYTEDLYEFAIIDTPGSIDKLLGIIKDRAVDNFARLCIFEVLGRGRICNEGHLAGATSICLDILSDPTEYKPIQLSALQLMTKSCYAAQSILRKDLIRDALLALNDSRDPALVVHFMDNISGWYYEPSICNYSYCFTVPIMVDIVPFLVEFMKETPDHGIIGAIARLLSSVTRQNKIEGFSVLVDLGVVPLVISRIAENSDTSMSSLMQLLCLISDTQLGQDAILEQNPLGSFQLFIEILRRNASSNWHAEETRLYKDICVLIANLSFDDSITPILESILEEAESCDIMRFHLGLILQMSRTSYASVRDKTFLLLNSKVREEIITIGTTTMLSSVFKIGLIRDVDQLIKNDALEAVFSSASELSGNYRFWVSMTTLINIHQKSYDLFVTHGLSELLLKALGSSDIYVVYSCINFVEEVVKTEKGALALPTSRLVAVLASFLTPSESFIHDQLNSPIPLAQKAAGCLVNIMKGQPPATVAAVKEEIAKSTLEKAIILIEQVRCNIFQGVVSFENLVKEFNKSEYFKSFLAMQITILTTSQDMDEISRAVFILRKFSIEPLKLSNEKVIKSLTTQFSSLQDEKLAQFLVYNALDASSCSNLLPFIIALPIDSFVTRVFLNKLSILLNEKSDDIVHIVLNSNFVSYLISYSDESKISIRWFSLSMYVMWKLMKKVIAMGDVKIREFGELLLKTNVLQAIEKSLKDDPFLNRDVAKYSCNLLGMLSLIAELKNQVLDILHNCSFKVLLEIKNNPEGNVLVVNDHTIYKNLQKACNISNFSSLHALEQSILIQTIGIFADKKSVYSFDSLEFVPFVCEVIRNEISSYSKFLANNCQNVQWASYCFSQWCCLGDAGLVALSGHSEILNFVVQVEWTSYNCGSKNINNFYSGCKTIFTQFVSSLEHEQAVYDGLNHITKMLTSLNSSPVRKRFAIKLLYQLLPLNDYTPLVIKMKSMNCIVQIIPTIISILTSQGRDRLRDQTSDIRFFLSSLIKAEVCMKAFLSCKGGISFVNLLKTEEFAPELYVGILQTCANTAPRIEVDLILGAGLLEGLNPIFKAGTRSRVYSSSLAVVQLICTFGSDSQRSFMGKSEAVQEIFNFLSIGAEGSVLTDQLIRTLNLVAMLFEHSPSAESYILSLIDRMQLSDVNDGIVILKKLKWIISDLSELTRSKIIFETKLPEVLNHFLKQPLVNDDENLVLGCIKMLSRSCPEKCVVFADECTKLIYKKVSELKDVSIIAHILSILAEESSNAHATICATAQRVFQDWDSGSEAFALSILKILACFCYFKSGTITLIKIGIIDIATQVLARAKTSETLKETLTLLSNVAMTPTTRILMRHLVESITSILFTRFRVEVINTHITINNSSPLSSTKSTPADVVNGNLSYKYDVFLSHDWATDLQGRNNHDRVEKVNSFLQLKGCKTWFDSQQMRGDLNSRMIEGISGSEVILVFITQNYIKKASGLGPKGEDDNCFFEFDNACLERGRRNMIPIIMEPECRDISSWLAGTVKGKLGTKLYIDLAEEEGKDSYRAGLDRLVYEIEVLSSRKFDGISTAYSSTGNIGTGDGTNINEGGKEVSNSSSERRVVGLVSQKDLDVGYAALSFLGYLSLAEPLRLMLASKEMLEALHFIFDRHSNCRQGCINIISNIYAPLIDLQGLEAEMCTRCKLAQTLILKDNSISSVLIPKLKESLRVSKWNFDEFKQVDYYLSIVLNLSMCDKFRSILIESHVLEIVSLVQTEGSENLVKPSNSTKSIVSEIFMHIASNKDLRQKMIEFGVEKVLDNTLLLVQEDSDIEEDSCLWYSTKRALDVLRGKIDDKTIKTGWMKTVMKNSKDFSAFSDVELLQIPIFQTFICHKRSTSQDFARLLHSLCITKGWSSFLDVENLQNIDMLSQIIAGCDVFVCVLSDGFLESPFCRKELTAAVTAELPIQLIVKEGSRWPDQYGSMTDLFPSNELIDGAFKGDEEICRPVFKLKAMQHSNEYFRAFSVNFLRRIESALEDIVRKETQLGITTKQRILQQRKMILRSNIANIDEDLDDSVSPGQKNIPVIGGGRKQEHGNLTPRLKDDDASLELDNSFANPLSAFTRSQDFSPGSVRSILSSGNSSRFDVVLSTSKRGVLHIMEDVKSLLSLDADLPLLEAVATANDSLGITSRGTLIQQVARIKEAIGLLR